MWFYFICYSWALAKKICFSHLSAAAFLHASVVHLQCCQVPENHFFHVAREPWSHFRSHVKTTSYQWLINTPNSCVNWRFFSLLSSEERSRCLPKFSLASPVVQSSKPSCRLSTLSRSSPTRRLTEEVAGNHSIYPWVGTWFMKEHWKIV